jgi:hypothetical protein
MSERRVSIRTRDGLRLVGTLTVPDALPRRAAVLVHGGGVTREEGGFFARLASGLAEKGSASLRFDLRGHGESEGRQEELTLASILTDITAALALVRDEVAPEGLALLGASFSGGICAYFASRHPEALRSLVMLNPLLNYKKRFIDDKPYWYNEQIDEAAGRELAANGFVAHSPTFKLSRPLLNEVFYLEPHQSLSRIITPTLIIHGSKDTFIPIESSRQASTQLVGETKLIEIDGAQHGIAVHDDPTYADPQTKKWQAFAIESVADWVISH